MLIKSDIYQEQAYVKVISAIHITKFSSHTISVKSVLNHFIHPSHKPHQNLNIATATAPSRPNGPQRPSKNRHTR
jgi:hypothetical protein